MLAVKACSILPLLGSICIFLFLLDKIATESKVMHWSAMIVSAKSAETWPGGMWGGMREAEGVLALLLPLTAGGVPDKAPSPCSRLLRKGHNSGCSSLLARSSHKPGHPFKLSHTFMYCLPVPKRVSSPESASQDAVRCGNLPSCGSHAVLIKQKILSELNLWTALTLA